MTTREAKQSTSDPNYKVLLIKPVSATDVAHAALHVASFFLSSATKHILKAKGHTR